ncbi:MAG: ATP-binding protein [Acidimicrobiales bacterium]
MTVPPVLMSGVVGQPSALRALGAAVAAPVHAYLLVGPPGSGKKDAALAFAAGLLCPQMGCGHCETCRRVLAGLHPDAVLHQRSGAWIGVDDAREITRLALRHPMEAARQVLILDDFHLVDRAGPALLKTIEEPPASTVFVVLADFVSPALVTIASRCAAVEFGPLTPSDLMAILQTEGLSMAEAASVASLAGGSLDRARLLAHDPGATARHELWQAVPSRLDGTGATVARITDELLAACDQAVDMVRAAQEEELATLSAQARSGGEKSVTGRKEIEDRHRRQQRRVRTDELRSGLGDLAEVYRDRLAQSGARREARGLDAVQAAVEALVRNPNEALLLQALLMKLSLVEI